MYEPPTQSKQLLLFAEQIYGDSAFVKTPPTIPQLDSSGSPHQRKRRKPDSDRIRRVAVVAFDDGRCSCRFKTQRLRYKPIGIQRVHRELGRRCTWVGDVGCEAVERAGKRRIDAKRIASEGKGVLGAGERRRRVRKRRREQGGRACAEVLEDHAVVGGCVVATCVQHELIWIVGLKGPVTGGVVDKVDVVAQQVDADGL